GPARLAPAGRRARTPGARLRPVARRLVCRRRGAHPRPRRRARRRRRAARDAPAVPRYRLVIEYDGGGFVGWQRQKTGLSVQGVVEAAIARFCGETPTVHGAGRTDAGVHALAQVAHVDLSRAAAPETIRGALNHHLRPHPVSILAVEAAPEGFHARLSAVGRHYRYRILNRRAPPALERGRVWHVAPPLDLAAMQAGARHLVGHHDFSTFRDSLCQA